MKRIYLSPPDVGEVERNLLLEAFDSNWISSVGPDVEQFEAEVAERVGTQHAVALSSGTAALQLALLVAGVGPGDEVLVPSLTFVATANAVTYTGAAPTFIDSEARSWNVDPDLLVAELHRRARSGNQVAAVITVDLYGQCADHAPIRDACRNYEVPLIEDAAEALGATYGSSPAGTLADMGVFSFNGNKIITTGGGGMLVTDRADWAARVRKLATQAREPQLHYEHEETGFNFRMSNLLAAVGRGQLTGLEAKVARRQEINRRYRAALERVPGVAFMPDSGLGESTWWLTALTVDPDVVPVGRDGIISRLAAEDIEARPVWKPMHLQPLFKSSPVIGGPVAAALFEDGLCLPSGSALSDAELESIIGLVLEAVA